MYVAGVKSPLTHVISLSAAAANLVSHDTLTLVLCDTGYSTLDIALKRWSPGSKQLNSVVCKLC